MPGLLPSCHVSPLGWGRVLALAPGKCRAGSARKVTARSSPRATSWPPSVARAMVVRGRPGADTARGLAMNRLRAAREERGWSQSRLMYELERHAVASGLAVPGRESLRIMLSRWENGRVRPNDSYRRLLSSIHDRTATELGIDDSKLASAARGTDLLHKLPSLQRSHRRAGGNR